MPLHARHSTGTLHNLAFFERWSDDELEHFERVAERAAFRSGDVLIREGEPGYALLILIAGEAEVSQGGVFLRRLYPGDHAGAMALLDDEPASATVVACTDIDAFLLRQGDFHNLLETVPSLGRRILANLARWFRKTTPEA